MKSMGINALKSISFLLFLMFALAGKNVCAMEIQRNSVLGNLGMRESCGLRGLSQTGRIDLSLKSLQARYKENCENFRYGVEGYSSLIYDSKKVGYFNYCDEKVGNKIRRNVDWLSYFDRSIQAYHALGHIKKIIKHSGQAGISEVVILERACSGLIGARPTLAHFGFVMTELPRVGAQYMRMAIKPSALPAQELNTRPQYLNFIHEGTVIGKICYQDKRVNGGVRRYIADLEVYGEYRNKGHGSRHMKEFIEQSRGEGITEITLSSLARPASFYGRLGFTGGVERAFLKSLESSKPKNEVSQKKTFSISTMIPSVCKNKKPRVGLAQLCH